MNSKPKSLLESLNEHIEELNDDEDNELLEPEDFERYY